MLSEQRRSITPIGNIRYQLKAPYRDGTAYIIFKPLDLIARLAALESKPTVTPPSARRQGGADETVRRTKQLTKRGAQSFAFRTTVRYINVMAKSA